MTVVMGVHILKVAALLVCYTDIFMRHGFLCGSDSGVSGRET